MRRKIELYIVSLWLLFLLIIVNRTQMQICWSCSFIGFKQLFHDNVIPTIALLFFLLGFIFYFRFRYTIDGTALLPVKIKKIEHSNYEHLTFLTTYIIPLICFDLSQIRYAVDLLILLIIIGAIYVKTNMFYANPTLALLGYNVYKVETSQGDNLIYISKDKLEVSSWVSSLQLDHKTYFVKKTTQPENE
ncbi:anti-phage protein KwaA [Pedobacter fastidiosus]|uniref:Uncharacterized protein n=1 Tax=Pedobacter fastidiosus TaxID=2765361 RepID=A0ABR7KTZ3_9SPHI|nr:anti-phage protein KwaA [Pedobacter fastidiosus]MBC6111527.1 hypothetical protein [Pedobacter fastidiosus]